MFLLNTFLYSLNSFSFIKSLNWQWICLRAFLVLFNKAFNLFIFSIGSLSIRIYLTLNVGSTNRTSSSYFLIYLKRLWIFISMYYFLQIVSLRNPQLKEENIFNMPDSISIVNTKFGIVFALTDLTKIEVSILVRSV